MDPKKVERFGLALLFVGAILLGVYCSGCVYVMTSAEFVPSEDGEAATKRMVQRVLATAGGNVSEAVQQFTATATDTGWIVQSGTNTQAVQTPQLPVEAISLP